MKICGSSIIKGGKTILEKAILLKNVSKEYKIKKRKTGLAGSLYNLFSNEYDIMKAVNNVSFDIEKGEIVGYLGPNGAGKSSTIKMMTGIMEPTGGEIFINGEIPYKKRTQVAENIGVVFGQRTQLWWALPAIESFNILKKIYRIDKRKYDDMMEFYSEMIDMNLLYNKTVRQMSLGQRVLCDILASFLHEPSIVFLDEPTIGLDISMKYKIRDIIRSLNKRNNTTVMLTSHDVGDIDALCERVIIIDRGTNIFDGSIDKLKNKFGQGRKVSVYLDESKGYIDKTISRVSRDFSRYEKFTIYEENGWIVMEIDDITLKVTDIINYFYASETVLDIKVSEVTTESVIKTIYDGARYV